MAIDVFVRNKDNQRVVSYSPDYDWPDSIVEVGWNNEDQAERYWKWSQTGEYSVNGRCFDIGNTTIAALHRFHETGDAQTSGAVCGTFAGAYPGSLDLDEHRGKVQAFLEADIHTFIFLSFPGGKTTLPIHEAVFAGSSPEKACYW